MHRAPPRVLTRLARAAAAVGLLAAAVTGCTPAAPNGGAGSVPGGAAAPLPTGRLAVFEAASLTGVFADLAGL